MLRETSPSLVLGVLLACAANAAAEEHGLRATYHDDLGFAGATLSRVDPAIDFAWGDGSPDPAISPDTFSARWVGQLEAPTTGDYLIATESDDGIRVRIGGDLVISDWTDHPPTRDEGTIHLTAGQRYDLIVDYYENGGGALARLLWRVQGGSEVPVPTEALFPAPANEPFALRTATASRVSPAWIAGSAAADATVTGRLDGRDLVVIRSADTWHLGDAGVALDPAAPAQLSVSDGATTISASLSWEATDLADHYGADVIPLRPGDSLLIRDSAADDAEIDPDYDAARGFVPVHRLVGGAAVPIRFDRPGRHLVRGRTGDLIGPALEVHVVAVDWRGPTACQIGYERTKDIVLDGAAFIHLGASDPFVLAVAARGDDAVSHLRVSPMTAGECALVATIGDEWGPEIARQRVDSFALWTTARRSTFVDRTYPDGSTLSRATLFIEPPVRGLDVSLRIFVGGVTFEDGSTTLAVSTDAFAIDLSSQSPQASFAYGLIRLPGIPWGVCHAYVARQDGVQVSR